MRDFIGELGYFGKQLAQWSFGLALVLLSLAVISPAHLGFAASAGLFGLMMLGGMCGYMLLANAIPALDLRDESNSHLRYAPRLYRLSLGAFALYRVVASIVYPHRGRPLTVDHVLSSGGVLLIAGTTILQKRRARSRTDRPQDSGPALIQERVRPATFLGYRRAMLLLRKREAGRQSLTRDSSR
jgi:hypothetical protein